MKIKTLFLLTSLLASSVAMAGSGPAIVECKSASGKTKVEFVTQDLYTHGELFMIQIEGNSMEYHSVEENVTKPDMLASLILFNYNSKHKILNLTAQKTGESGKEYFSTLTALPASIKVTNNQSHSLKLKFEAIYKGFDPRTGEDFYSEANSTDEIYVDCTLDYTI
ncbi:hypothetical protein GW915_08365 [bacterium]|nr:hypothetical protein [bacterium]